MVRFVFVPLLIAVYLLSAVVCPPVTQPAATAKPEEGDNEQNEDMGLEYERYLKEVVRVLESDESFRKKLEESNISEIQTGEIAKHLDFVAHGIRTKLDEIKRNELDRLRQVMRLKSYLQNSLKVSHPDVVLPEINKERLLGHLDHANPNSFEVADLAKLIQQASKDLGEIDRKRKEEFKNYEMEKEILRRQQLQSLNETQRLEEEKKFEEMEKKHDDHPKLHHPGNEEQLKEVWEESDGLNEKDFDPKTFFHLHDSNGDGYLDSAEVEALFQKELDKVYDPNAPEDDMLERYEEMNRMREHFVNETDRNKDSMISLQEFIDNSKRDEFKTDEEWQPLDSDDVFNEEDLAKFQENYEQLQKQKEVERMNLEKLRMDLELRGHASVMPPKARLHENGEKQEMLRGGDKQEQPVAPAQHHVQQPVQQPVAHDQPLMHGQLPAQQPVQHMQKQQEQPMHQPVVHKQSVVKQPVAHQQPQQPVVAEQHAQPPAVFEQHLEELVAKQEPVAPANSRQAPQPVDAAEHPLQPDSLKRREAPRNEDAAQRRFEA